MFVLWVTKIISSATKCHRRPPTHAKRFASPFTKPPAPLCSEKSIAEVVSEEIVLDMKEPALWTKTPFKMLRCVKKWVSYKFPGSIDNRTPLKKSKSAVCLFVALQPSCRVKQQMFVSSFNWPHSRLSAVLCSSFAGTVSFCLSQIVFVLPSAPPPQPSVLVKWNPDMSSDVVVCRAGAPSPSCLWVNDKLHSPQLSRIMTSISDNVTGLTEGLWEAQQCQTYITILRYVILIYLYFNIIMSTGWLLTVVASVAALWED